jgi:outer membrane immunogenic protein
MKAILVGCALSLLAVPSFGADLAALPSKALPFASFTWTSCYAGGQVGGGWENSNLTDPVQLVQDSFLFAGATTSVTTVGVNSTGFVGGGQIGCDYQFDPRWVVGIEGAILGSTLKGSATMGLPLGNPGDMATVSAKTDFIPSVTARVGYALDRVLLYAKGGVAWAGDTYDVTGSFTGIPFGFEGLDTRTGFTVGGGVEWAFSGPWSVNFEYDYYQFGSGTVLMSDPINVLSGPVNAKESIQAVMLGLNFHVFAGQGIAP